MTGLFFAVDPIWWIGTLHLSSVWIAISVGLIIGLGLWYRDRTTGVVQVQERESYTYHPMDVSVENYAELTLREIRRYLTYRYQPQHSWAHIPSQIDKYATDKSLTDIIGQLERSEYSKSTMTAIEKEQINRELVVKLKT
ncbi:hypothetical protein H7170_04280 [Candidatus Gracilibacteria bacterium]|nr:hypothetical protein [Candidatus Gracilibacteria bacterium]